MRGASRLGDPEHYSNRTVSRQIKGGQQTQRGAIHGGVPILRKRATPPWASQRDSDGVKTGRRSTTPGDVGPAATKTAGVKTHVCQERSSDLIGPYWGTYGIAYRVLQTLVFLRTTNSCINCKGRPSLVNDRALVTLGQEQTLGLQSPPDKMVGVGLGV